jgi:hypothetical protein
MIRMMATTISSSINENPFCLRMESLSSGKTFRLFFRCFTDDRPASEILALVVAGVQPFIPPGYVASR